MFDLKEFFQELDVIYRERPREAEAFLRKGLTISSNLHDMGAELAILNELIGYYRVQGPYEEGEKCIRSAFDLIRYMGIMGTMNHATTLLNAGTAKRVMKKFDEAGDYYDQAYEIYKREIVEPDYRMATFYNNRSLLYAEMGQPKKAKKDLLQALELIQQLQGSDVEIAITHVNIGNICISMKDLEEAEHHFQKAKALFEVEDGVRDPHYASVLAGLGELHFHREDYGAAAEYMLLAMEEIKKNYGVNASYRTIKSNYELILDMKKRREAILRSKMKGMEIAKQYYEQCGKPMLEKKYAEYVDRIAVGLIGEGSECLGYDDQTSTDHDFGPGFCIWLTESDYEAIGKQLEADYNALPGEFLGYPVRNVTEHGGGRVGVCSMDAFYRKYIGCETPEKMRDIDWLRMDMSALKTVTNGEVFADPLGEFTRRREGFSKYPEHIRKRKIAEYVGQMGQSGQYNYSRMKKRQDEGASYLSLATFTEAAIKAAYVLNGQYAPFYKWMFRGMDEFEVLRELQDKLLQLTRVDAKEDASALVEEICAMFVAELNRQGLTSSTENFLEIQRGELLR